MATAAPPALAGELSFLEQAHPGWAFRIVTDAVPEGVIWANPLGDPEAAVRGTDPADIRRQIAQYERGHVRTFLGEGATPGVPRATCGTCGGYLPHDCTGSRS